MRKLLERNLKFSVLSSLLFVKASWLSGYKLYKMKFSDKRSKEQIEKEIAIFISESDLAADELLKDCQDLEALICEHEVLYPSLQQPWGSGWIENIASKELVKYKEQAARFCYER